MSKKILLGLGLLVSGGSYFWMGKPPSASSQQEIPSFFKDQIGKANFQPLTHYYTYLRSRNKQHFFQNLVLSGDAFSFFQVYSQPDIFTSTVNKLIVVFSPKEALQAHDRICHGGFTATLIDNFFGAVAGMNSGFGPVATANLNLNYRKPLKVGEFYLLQTEVFESQSKKIRVKCKIVDCEGKLCAQGTGLMIKVEWSSKAWSTVSQYLKTLK